MIFHDVVPIIVIIFCLSDVWPDDTYFKELEDKEVKIKKVEENDKRMQEWYEQSKKVSSYTDCYDNKINNVEHMLYRFQSDTKQALGA